MKRRLIAGIAAAAVALGSGAVAAREFNASIWFPDTHPLTKFGYLAWAKTLEQQSNGQLKAKVFTGTALLPPGAHLSGLRDGVAHATYHAGTYTPSDLPEDNVISMLALGVSDTMAVTFAVTDFYMTDPDMAARFKQLGIVFAGGYATPPYNLMCTKKVATLADFKGLKVRMPGVVHSDWGKTVGIVPVNVPSSEMFTGLEKGQIDCAANAANDMKSRSLWDVAKHTSTISLGLYWAGWQWGFNGKFWRELKPEERRVLLDSIADTIPVMMLGYMKESEDALKEAPGKGVTVHPETDEMRKSVKDFSDNAARKAAIELGQTKLKVKDPEALLKRFEASLAKWDGLLKNVDRNDPKALAKVLKDNLYSKIDDKTYGIN
ncbi:MAG: C4-dicarboxylate TRAP transporter substrate-binding protein [Novosphingobium sp.]|jgi:TRAP-type C4-dicarboxylate transport system substrate-binding protein|uniref:C4-dicarboxylate TRAP transporter substrate-binding protein n=1 Tax=Novosphingobium sp. TaxID=1874826 RepID=UPI0022CAA694|nr:C4-dicarboxylate TRAP transporter substrate-binding protein [Novosphingobium sp.]MCZ8036170.1 C4-dicarboxylate TRAP transporter substrate-binding protein [Novosphingobium sp.]